MNRDKLEFVRINFLNYELVEPVEIMYDYDYLIDNIGQFGSETDDIGELAENEKFVSLFELKKYAPDEYKKFMKHRTAVIGDYPEEVDVVVGCYVTLMSVQQIKNENSLTQHEEFSFENVDCSVPMIELLTAESYKVEEVNEDGDIRLKMLFGIYPKEIIRGVVS